MAIARIAGPAERIFAITRALPVTRSTAVTPSSLSRMRDTVFICPISYNDIEAAPLLCAGLIGYRSYRKAGNARRLGMYGFGNAAHLIAQIAIYEGRELFAFTRPGDRATQQAAKELGAVWAGGSDEMPPAKLDAAIIFASVGPLVPGGAPHARERRHCGLRRNSHDRYTIVSLCQSMGRARDYVSGQLDAARW